MGEAWKLLTAQFTFTAATLTLVVFIFINVNMALDDLKLFFPELKEAARFVPDIKYSIQNATETAGLLNFKIANMENVIESIVSRQKEDFSLLKKRIEEYSTGLDAYGKANTIIMSEIEETTKLLMKICEQVGCNAG
mgnify:CR=1 FL=1